MHPDVQETAGSGSQLLKGDGFVDGRGVLRVAERDSETPRHRDQAFVDAGEQRVEHRLFAGEMVVDGTLLDADCGGEVSDGGTRETVNGETLLRDVQQGGSGVTTHGILLASGCGFGTGHPVVTVRFTQLREDIPAQPFANTC